MSLHGIIREVEGLFRGIFQYLTVNLIYEVFNLKTWQNIYFFAYFATNNKFIQKLSKISIIPSEQIFVSNVWIK